MQPEKLSHSEAISFLKSAGIETHSSGECSDRSNSKCNSLEQINRKTISELIKYKTTSRCSTVVTGGTEIGHAPGAYSHWNGYKIDIELNKCHDAFIKSNFTYAGERADGAPVYKDEKGNTWAKKKKHWDIFIPN